MIGNLPFIQWLTRRRGLALLSSAREWLLDCGDGVRLQGFLSLTREHGGAQEMNVDSAGSRIALILHGWEGSAESCYVVSLGAELIGNGFDVLRLNLRDHGESHHLNREIFHSCRLAEVVGATRALAERYPRARIFLADFSLGGNFVLRVAADAGAPAAIVGAVGISPVLDPALTLEALERGWFLYRRYFVRRWSRSLRRKRRAWPDLPDCESWSHSSSGLQETMRHRSPPIPNIPRPGHRDYPRGREPMHTCAANQPLVIAGSSPAPIAVHFRNFSALAVFCQQESNTNTLARRNTWTP